MNKGLVFVSFATVLLLSVSFSSAFSVAGFSVSDFFAKVFGQEVQKSPSSFNVSNQTIALNRTHLECRNMQCVAVNGKGQNRCSSSAQCYNTVCMNSTCTRVVGNGSRACSTIGGYCEPSHLECINSMCTVVSGNGTNQCSSAGMTCNGTGNQSKPDLVITSHTFTYANITGNTTHRNVTVITRVTNIGSAVATVSSTRLQVRAQVNYTLDRNTQPLAPGASVDLRQEYTLPLGYWYAYSNADQNLVVAEISEINNDRTTGFAV